MITLSVPVYYFIVTLHKSNLIDSGNNYLHTHTKEIMFFGMVCLFANVTQEVMARFW